MPEQHAYLGGALVAFVTGEEVWQFVLWIAWTAVFGAVCIGRCGGVQRIQNGYLARDPASLTGR